MTPAQSTAIEHPCRLAIETMHPRFQRVVLGTTSIVLTVNNGYE